MRKPSESSDRDDPRELHISKLPDAVAVNDVLLLERFVALPFRDRLDYHCTGGQSSSSLVWARELARRATNAIRAK